MPKVKNRKKLFCFKIYMTITFFAHISTPFISIHCTKKRIIIYLKKKERKKEIYYLHFKDWICSLFLFAHSKLNTLTLKHWFNNKFFVPLHMRNRWEVWSNRYKFAFDSCFSIRIWVLFHFCKYTWHLETRKIKLKKLEKEQFLNMLPITYDILD